MAFELRYRVYVDEMKMPLASADHVRRAVEDAEDAFALIYLVRNAHGDVIATSRSMIGARTGREELQRVYDAPPKGQAPGEDCSFSARLAVLAWWRKGTVLQELCTFMFRTLESRGVRYDFMVCTPGLVRLYEKLGYRRYKDAVRIKDLGYRVPLVLRFEDEAYLGQIRSPFAGQRSRSRGIGVAPSSFAGDARYDIPNPTLLVERFGLALRSRRDGLLSALEDSELLTVFRTFTTHRAATGDELVVAGTAGDELFCILDGDASESARHADGDRRIAIRTAGDCVGVAEFRLGGLRDRDVLAGRAGALLLVIDRSAFDSLCRALPRLGQRLRANLEDIVERDESSAKAGREGSAALQVTQKINGGIA